MIDAHCHLNFHAFNKDVDEVIKRSQAAGVERIINTGTKLDSSAHALQLAEQYDNLYAIVGVHPHHADKIEEEGDWVGQLKIMTNNPKVVGIGEIGMDYFSYHSNGIVDPKLQKSVFEQQIMLAYNTGLPLQIHNRQAGEDVIEVLKAHRNYLQAIPGMFHCFAGSMQVLKEALNLGFFIGFDGNLTYPGMAPGETTALSDIAKYVPLERIICETDSPYLTAVPHRGQRNEPQYVILVGQQIARLKQISYEKVKQQTIKNTYTVFKRLK